MERRQTRDQWKGIIEDWRGAGQSQRSYCAQNDLVYSAFRYWFRKLKGGLEVTEGKRRQVRAIEITHIAMPSVHKADQKTTKPNIDARGIVIPIAGSDAAVTIVGKVSLGQLGRIIAACEGRADHAPA